MRPHAFMAALAGGIATGCANRLDVDNVPMLGRAWSSAWLVMDMGEGEVTEQLVVSSGTGICKKSRKLYESVGEVQQAYLDADVSTQEAECEASWTYLRDVAKLARKRYPADSWELLVWPDDPAAFPEERTYDTDADDLSGAFAGRVEVQPAYTFWDLIIDISPYVYCDDPDTADYYAYDNYEFYSQYISATDGSKDWGSWQLMEGSLDITEFADDTVSASVSGELRALDPTRVEGSIEAQMNADRCEIDATDLGAVDDGYLLLP